jgi:hypothetical protein
VTRATPFTAKQREALKAERAREAETRARDQQLVAETCGELMLRHGGEAALQAFKERLAAKRLPIPKLAWRTEI